MPSRTFQAGRNSELSPAEHEVRLASDADSAVNCLPASAVALGPPLQENAAHRPEEGRTFARLNGKHCCPIDSGRLRSHVCTRDSISWPPSLFPNSIRSTSLTHKKKRRFTQQGLMVMQTPQGRAQHGFHSPVTQYKALARYSKWR